MLLLSYPNMCVCVRAQVYISAFHAAVDPGELVCVCVCVCVRTHARTTPHLELWTVRGRCSSTLSLPSFRRARCPRPSSSSCGIKILIYNDIIIIIISLSFLPGICCLLTPIPSPDAPSLSCILFHSHLFRAFALTRTLLGLAHSLSPL